MKKEILSEIQIKKLIQFCKKGDHFHNDDNYNQAIAYYNMAIEIDPKYRDVWRTVKLTILRKFLLGIGKINNSSMVKII